MDDYLQICQISNGTLATLSGHNDYAALDTLYANFMGFYKDQTATGVLYATWIDVWTDYAKTPECRSRCAPGFPVIA